MTVDPLDRVVSLEAERTHLSGRTSRLEVRLEISGTRTDLFLLELPGRVVLEALSSGRARAIAGEPLVPRPPPPGARPVAEDASELERRLRTLGVGGDVRPDREQLLRASGLTPLLADDLWRLVERGATPADAFRRMKGALASPRATLRLRRSASPRDAARPCELAPIPPPPGAVLDDVSCLVPGSFNEAMREGTRLAEESRRARSVYRELSAAVSRRFRRLRTLREKLTRELNALPDPAEARRHGERLLAARASARSSRPGFVVLPDPFDEETRDVEVPVDPRLGLVANAERWFRRSRKAERTFVAVEKRLRTIAAEVDYVEHLRLAIEDASSAEELESLRDDVVSEGVVSLSLSGARSRDAPEKKTRGSPRRTLPPRRFETSKGHALLVGRSARSNEELTFRIARPDDLWFHAAGRAGAHVVLRVPDGSEAEPEEIEQAARLAAYFSKARNDSYVEVLVTERRNVSKLRGAPPGTVRVREARSLRVPPAAPGERRERISRTR